MCRTCLDKGAVTKELAEKNKDDCQCCSCGTIVLKKDAVKAGSWWCLNCYHQSKIDEKNMGTVLCCDCGHRIDQTEAVNHNNKWWCKTCHIMETEK